MNFEPNDTETKGHKNTDLLQCSNEIIWEFLADICNSSSSRPTQNLDNLFSLRFDDIW